MFSLPVRITIIALAIALGIYRLSEGNGLGYLYLVAAVLFAVGYFRYGPIRAAFQATQRGQYKKAQNLIRTIRFPTLLNAQSKAYLHWINAILAMEMTPTDLASAEQDIRLAIAGKLRTSNDRCLATATLASILYQNNDLENAQAVLIEAENIPHKEAASQHLQNVRQEFLKAAQDNNELD